MRPQTQEDMGSRVQPFVSTTTNKLDAKRRVSVPASFRNILKNQDLQGFYCLRSDSEPGCLEAFGAPVMAFYTDRLRGSEPLFNDAHDDEAQRVFGESQELKFDDEGRVQLPREFIEHAGITEQVLFVGLDQKFQIWDPDRYEKVRAQRLTRIRAARAAKAAPS